MSKLSGRKSGASAAWFKEAVAEMEDALKKVELKRRVEEPEPGLSSLRLHGRFGLAWMLSKAAVEAALKGKTSLVLRKKCKPDILPKT